MSAIFTEQEIAEFGLEVPDESEIQMLVDDFLMPSPFGLFAVTYGQVLDRVDQRPGCYCAACVDTSGSTYDVMCQI